MIKVADGCARETVPEEEGEGLNVLTNVHEADDAKPGRGRMSDRDASFDMATKFSKMAARLILSSFANLALLAALCSDVSSASNANECQQSYFAFGPGRSATETMIVKSGVRCPTTVNTSVSSFRAIEITKAPMHGAATVLGLHGWAYQSRAGYAGPDSFLVTVQRIGVPSWITVDVTVTQ